MPIRAEGSDESPLPFEIGSAAGEVYKFLHDKGEVTMNQLRRELPMGRGRVDQAIGWLARERKLSFTQQKRTTFVRLSETKT